MSASSTPVPSSASSGDIERSPTRHIASFLHFPLPFDSLARTGTHRVLRLSATKRAQKSHESLQRMHPIHAILGIGLLAVIAAVLGRFISFYRRELQFIGPV